MTTTKVRGVSYCGNFRLRNDLYCVGWGVKLYSLTYCGNCMQTLCHLQKPGKMTMSIIDKRCSTLQTTHGYCAAV